MGKDIKLTGATLLVDVGIDPGSNFSGELQSMLTKAANNLKPITVKVDKIDASSAIAAFQKELMKGVTGKEHEPKFGEKKARAKKDIDTEKPSNQTSRNSKVNLEHFQAKHAGEIDKLRQKLADSGVASQQTSEKLSRLGNELKNLDTSGIDGFKASLEGAKVEVDQLIAAASRLHELNDFKSKQFGDLAKLEQDLLSSSANSNELRNSIAQVGDELQSLQIGDKNKWLETFRSLRNEITQTIAAKRELDALALFKIESGADLNKLDLKLSSTSADATKYKEDVVLLRQALNDLGSSDTASWKQRFGQLSTDIDQVVGSAKQLNKLELFKIENAAGLDKLKHAMSSAGTDSEKLRERVDQLAQQLASLDNSGIDGFKQDLAQLNAEINQSVTNAKQLKSLETFKENNGIAVDAQGLRLDQLGADTGELKNRIQELRTELSGLDASGMENWTKSFATASKEIDQLEKKVQSFKLTQKKFEQHKGLESDYFGSNKLPKNPELDQLFQQAGRLRASFKDVDKDAWDVAKAQQYADVLSQIQSKLGAVRKESTSNKAQQQEIINFQNLKRAAEDYLNANARISKNAQLNADFNNFIKKAADPANFESGFKEAQSYFNELRAAARSYGLEAETTATKIKKLFNSHLGMAVIMASIAALKQTFSDVLKSIQEIDKAMTELKKVSNLSDAGYQEFFARASGSAKEYGSTISDMINSTADFARLGYSVDDSLQLAQSANIYKNVGDGIRDIGAASESIISTIKAFGIEATNSMQIVDKFNEVGNNFAVSSSGIGEALKRSASALAAAGNDIDESIGLVTAANTVVQDPEKVGTALKTLSMRLRGAKADMEEAGLETDGMAESTSKLRAELLALTGQKVDIMLDDETFKSTYQIIKEMSEVWSSMTDINQAAALELMGGKMQGNILASMIQNFDVAEQALATAANSSGSALRENETHLDSIEGKTAKLKATLESFGQNAIGSDVFKGLIDGATKLLEVLDNLAASKAGLPALIAGFTTIMAMKGKNTLVSPVSLIKDDVTGATKSLGIFKRSVQEILDQMKNVNSFAGKAGVLFGGGSAMHQMIEKESAWLTKYLETVKESGKEAGKELFDAEASNAMRRYFASIKDGSPSIAGLTANLKANADASAGAAVKTALLEAASIALNAAITMVASVAITALVSGLSKLVTAEKDAIEASQELSRKWAEQDQNLQRSKQTIEDVGGRYKLLEKGVANSGKNISLSDSDFSEYKDIVGQIAAQFPDLVSGYDSAGVAILKCKGNVDALTAAFKEQERAANAAVIADADNMLEGFRNATTGKGGGFVVDKGLEKQLEILEAIQRIKKGDNEARQDFLHQYDDLGNKLAPKFGEADVAYALNESGIKLKWSDTNSSMIDKALQSFDKIQVRMPELTAEFKAWADDARTIPQSILGNNAMFQSLDDDFKNAINTLVSGLDYDFFRENSSYDLINEWVNGSLIANFDQPKFQNAMKGLLSLNADMLSADYKKQSLDFVKTIQDTTGRSSDEIRKMFGLVDTTELDAFFDKMSNPDFSNLKKGFQDALTINDQIAFKNVYDSLNAALDDSLGLDKNLVEPIAKMFSMGSPTIKEAISGMLNDSLSGVFEQNNRITDSMAAAFASGDNEAKSAISSFAAYANEAKLSKDAVRSLWEQFDKGGWKNADKEIGKLNEFSQLVKNLNLEEPKIDEYFEKFNTADVAGQLTQLDLVFDAGVMSIDSYNAKVREIAQAYGEVMNMDQGTIDKMIANMSKFFDVGEIENALKKSQILAQRLLQTTGTEHDMVRRKIEAHVASLTELRDKAMEASDVTLVDDINSSIKLLGALLESTMPALDRFKAAQGGADYDDQHKGYGSALSAIQEGLKTGKTGGKVFTAAWDAFFAEGVEVGSKKAKDAIKRFASVFKEDASLKDFKKAFSGWDNITVEVDKASKSIRFMVTNLEALSRETGLSQGALLGELEALQMRGFEIDWSNLKITDSDAMGQYIRILENEEIELTATILAGVEGTEEVEAAKKKLGEIIELKDKTQSELDNINTAKLEAAKTLYEEVAGENAEAKLTVETSGSGTLSETYTTLMSTDGTVATAEATVLTMGLDKIIELLEKLLVLNGYVAEPTVDVQVSGTDAVDNTNNGIKNLDGSRATAEVRVETTGAETFDETRAGLFAVNGYTAVANFAVKETGDYVDFANTTESLDECDGKNATASLSINVEGKEALDDTVNFLAPLNERKYSAYVQVNTEGTELISETGSNLASLDGTRVVTTVDVDTSALQSKLSDANSKLAQLRTAISSVSSMRVGDCGLSALASAAQNAINKLQAINDIELKDKSVTFTTINKTVNQTEDSSAAGADGGYSKGGKTLVGEEGVELVRSGDRAYLVGKNGPEIVMLQKGDQVFSNPETKHILKGRDEIDDVPAHATGTGSYSGGSGNSKRSNSGSSSNSSSSSRSNRNDDRSGNDSDSDYEEEARRAEEEAERAAEEAKREWEEMVRGMFRELEHKLRMDVIDEAEYYRQLAALNQQHYAGNAEYRDEYYSNLEKLRDWEKEKAQNAFRDLEYQRKMGVLSERQYFFEMSKLNDKYYQQRLIDLDEYRDKRLEILEGLKQDEIDTQEKKRDDYDSAYDAVKRTLEREIERLEAEKDALSDEDVEGSYGQRIKVLQDELDLMEKQNDQADRALALSRAREELERAKTQRKNLIYREGVGFVYEGDQNDIRDAQDELDDELFEESKRRIEDQIEELEKQAEAEEKVYDERIEQLTEYEEAWADAVESYQVEQDRLIAAQLLGADWEQQILDRRIDTIAKFKDEYNAVLAEIRRLQELSLEEYEKTLKPGEGGTDANSGKKPGSGDGTSTQRNKKTFLDYVERQKKGVQDWFDQMNKGWYPVTQGKYAKGTLDARAGLSVVDDGSGKELIVRKPTQGRYTFLEAGSVVYDAQKTRNLWDWGDFKPSELMEKVKKFAVPPKATIVPKSGDVSIQQGNIVIQGNADSSLIPQIRAEIERANQSLARELFQKSYQKV